MAPSPPSTPKSQRVMQRLNVYATWSRSPGTLGSRPWLGRMTSSQKRTPTRRTGGDGASSPPHSPSGRILTLKRILFKDFEKPSKVVFLSHNERTYLQGSTRKLAKNT
ncbi:hypothetical protein WMY93_029854 [Mugilogobius chulae]|uniref:Uncharacterized protein n=1 Tax=Mugilogobius chulae TaxID=88201 RepID=A0AAW0MM55_9GOBI